MRARPALHDGERSATGARRREAHPSGVAGTNGDRPPERRNYGRDSRRGSFGQRLPHDCAAEIARRRRDSGHAHREADAMIMTETSGCEPDLARSTLFRFRGSVGALDDASRRALFDRSLSSVSVVRERTERIVARVRQGGDAALRELAIELDGVPLESLEVPRVRWREALDLVSADVRRSLERSAR